MKRRERSGEIIKGYKKNPDIILPLQFIVK
jgi:hypothetical protein